MQNDLAALIQFLLNQGVAIAVLAFLLVRLERRLERIDRLMTIWAEHQGLSPMDGDSKQSLR